jgi:hypothetical protein
MEDYLAETRAQVVFHALDTILACCEFGNVGHPFYGILVTLVTACLKQLPSHSAAVVQVLPRSHSRLEAPTNSIAALLAHALAW